jgi:hypothetical protein
MAERRRDADTPERRRRTADEAEKGGFGEETIFEPVPEPTPGGETPRRRKAQRSAEEAEEDGDAT